MPVSATISADMTARTITLTYLQDGVPFTSYTCSGDTVTMTARQGVLTLSVAEAIEQVKHFAVFKRHVETVHHPAQNGPFAYKAELERKATPAPWTITSKFETAGEELTNASYTKGGSLVFQPRAAATLPWYQFVTWTETIEDFVAWADNVLAGR